jgi:hypothetical protein
MSRMPPRIAENTTVWPSGEKLGTRFVHRLHRNADLDLAGQHVLHDQRAFLGAHEIRQAIAFGDQDIQPTVLNEVGVMM